MKLKILSSVLVLSILGNIFLIWTMVSRQGSDGNVSVEYSSSIEMLHRSEEKMSQGMMETGAKQTDSYFQAYELLVTAQMFEKSYEKEFMQEGINVANLATFLQEQMSDLSFVISQKINGQIVQQEKVNQIDKNIQIMINTLPKTYDAHNYQSLKSAFSNLHS